MIGHNSSILGLVLFGTSQVFFLNTGRFIENLHVGTVYQITVRYWHLSNSRIKANQLITFWASQKKLDSFSNV